MGILSDKSSEEAVRALKDFAGQESIKELYSDDSPELLKACKEIGAIHGISIPGRPDTNGKAERAVRRVLEGARTLLLAAGLH